MHNLQPVLLHPGGLADWIETERLNAPVIQVRCYLVR